MSRSGYHDDVEQWHLIMYRGAVSSAMRGRRGQQFFRDLLAALDALPEKRLIEGDLECSDGVCALGALGRARGMDMTALDPEDSATVSFKFDIAEALAREVVFENDEAAGYLWAKETPEARFERMRRWVVANIKETT
jgi:hypothetical protein